MGSKITGAGCPTIYVTDYIWGTENVVNEHRFKHIIYREAWNHPGSPGSPASLGIVTEGVQRHKNRRIFLRNSDPLVPEDNR